MGMSLSDINIVRMLFQFITFLFAISVHESAHAWVAMRRGDPTAYMLGRVTLNPIKHIDPIGTLLLPVLGLLKSGGILGWAKPTPVNPRNFRHLVLDDILVSVAGPVSNFIVAVGALLLLAGISLAPGGRESVRGLAAGSGLPGTDSLIEPVVLLIYELLWINIVLAMFNLIPVPPLDGSHVIRHFLPEGIRSVFDRIGIVGLLVLVVMAPSLVSAWIRPGITFFHFFLTRL
jgi:Zn-dependent protease